MDEGRKAWRKLEGLRAYMMREKEERRRNIWNGKITFYSQMRTEPP